MSVKKIFFAIFLLVLTLTLSACGKAPVVTEIKVPAIPVKTQSVSQSLSVKTDLAYPGVVVAEREATITAKTSGNLTSLNFKVGDNVVLGQELAKVDDVNSPSFNANNFNTSQIKQAKLVLEQAESAYNLAKSSYNNLLVSSVKDLRSAEIARDQAEKGKTNLASTISESLKSAELSAETATIAVEQARLTLENRQKLAEQGTKDANTNADLAASTAMSTVSSIITNINNLTAFDDNNIVSIAYKSNLGALDSSAYSKSKQAYQTAKEAYANYLTKTFSTANEKVIAATTVVNSVQKLSDETKNLFDKTITSGSLPQTSLTGPSLSNLQAAAVAYQAQVSGLLSQLNGASQGLTNIDLNNTSLLDSLRQAYELAKQQKASADQALNNLRAGNTSQNDQASFAYSLAANQYDNLQIKIESQISAAKTQMETAEIQANNAALTLQSLYDAHSVIAPLTGTVTKVFIADGQAIAPGQPIATVSQTENIKVQFYVEPDNLSAIRPGLPLKVVDDKNTEYLGIVAAVSPQADPVTRRFLVEVKLENSRGLLLGTVVNVKVTLIKAVNQPGLLILPLSTLTVGQSDNYIFIVENGRAKKVSVEIIEVLGELAKIKAGLAAETQVIIEGNKLLQEGAEVTIQN